ncbi:hypothetical protein DPMN_121805 [Dreissena polymorpha]|uniref:Uncharacterized protein n=1 Tax=Dreissena polymorpha TaxID=45954 RepID=A0A9D4GRA4_DREPO|nr:hypothetical protein DPMN_121805 [Dreissena polymorpha]
MSPQGISLEKEDLQLLQNAQLQTTLQSGEAEYQLAIQVLELDLKLDSDSDSDY